VTANETCSAGDADRAPGVGGTVRFERVVQH
jgi:hypothetical protein